MRTPKRILERRRSVRIVESFVFKIGRQGYESRALSVNLSAHGVLAIIERDIPLMTQLEIALQLPLPLRKGSERPAPIAIKGVVVRKRRDPRTGRFLIAVYFSSVKASDQKKLEQFIGRYLKKS